MNNTTLQRFSNIEIALSLLINNQKLILKNVKVKWKVKI